MTDYIVKNLAELIRAKKNDVFRHLQIIQEARAKNMKFTDPEFPPEVSSLIRRMETPAKWRTFVWRRATDFMPPDKIKVFDQIDPNDILQGQLGDCYFLSCLSVLAERPKLIERLFLTEEPNEVGCYSVWLNDNGEWKSFIVDDFFPCIGPNRGPAFTRGNGNELWVLLLEKAYAKLHGSYDIIEGGDPAWALRDLTGAPWDFLDSTNPEDIWKFVIESDKKGYLITCYTRNTDIREEQNPLGIVFGHAYSILDAKEIVTHEGHERIIRIRNPWGKFEWKGDWGDDSDKWNENTKSQVNYENRDDGTFWMSVNDFVKYYEGVGISKLHENYQYKSISFDHKEEGKSYSIFRLIIREDTHIFLSVNQKDDRGFDQNLGYEYSTVRIMLGRIEENGLVYVDGRFFNDRNLVLENNLKSGYYIVTVEVNWRQKIHQKANLIEFILIGAYSEKKIDFEETVRADYDIIQRNLLKSFAYTNQAAKKKSYSNVGADNIFKYAGSHLGMIFFYYINQEDDKKLQETITATKFNNLQIQPPFHDNQKFTVELLPRDDFMVFYKIIDEREAFAISPSASSSCAEASRREVEENRHRAYRTTTYIDDPTDRTEQSRDVSFYDEYIKSNKDIYEEDPEKMFDVLKQKQEQKQVQVRPVNPNDGRDLTDPFSTKNREALNVGREASSTQALGLFSYKLWQNFPSTLFLSNFLI